MCGDIENEGFEGDLYQRFLVHSQTVLAREPMERDDLNSYLDKLFTEVLNRCVQDAQAVPSSDAYRRVAMQSLVLARLAGFMAGHVALNEDPLRKLMEAVMLGYDEADIPVPRHEHEHEHRVGLRQV